MNWKKRKAVRYWVMINSKVAQEDTWDGPVAPLPLGHLWAYRDRGTETIFHSILHSTRILHFISIFSSWF